MTQVYDQDRETAKDWLASGGLSDPIESVAVLLAELREELQRKHQPKKCNVCGSKCYFGERISDGVVVYCDYECAELGGEPWAEK